MLYIMGSNVMGCNTNVNEHFRTSIFIIKNLAPWGYSSVGKNVCLASRRSPVQVRLSPPKKDEYDLVFLKLLTG